MKLCSIDGCSKSKKARGMCDKHWARWRKHGDPGKTLTPLRGADPMVRFMSHVIVDTTGCWLWDGNKLPTGYGQFKIDGRNHLAHKWIYWQKVGSVPDGMELDHSCEVESCVNYNHLRPMTHAENMARIRVDNCVHGHPMSGSNLYVSPSGQRSCKICTNRRGREYHARKRLANA